MLRKQNKLPADDLKQLKAKAFTVCSQLEIEKENYTLYDFDKAFTTKSKKQKYKELVLQQQKTFDRVVREVSETEKIPSMIHQGGGHGQKNLEWEKEKLKILIQQEWYIRGSRYRPK